MKKFDPPAHLSQESAELWADLQQDYGITDSAGLLLLSTACESLDRLRQAQSNIKKNGITIKDRFGQARVNPACGVEKDSKAQMLTALKQLNLDIEPLKNSVGRPTNSALRGI